MFKIGKQPVVAVQCVGARKAGAQSARSAGAPPKTLFESLLGRHESVQEALDDASRRIATRDGICVQGKQVVRSGASSVKLYDLERSEAE